MFYRTIAALSLLFAIGVAEVGATRTRTPTPTPTPSPTPTTFVLPSQTSIAFLKNRVRMIILSKRAPNITNEEFSIYWANSHSKLFSSLPIVKRNLLKYEQAHTNLQNIPAINAIGFPTADWDGIAVFEATSYQKILDIFEDEEYKTRVIPDELKFADRPACLFLPLDLFEIFDKPSFSHRGIGA